MHESLPIPQQSKTIEAKQKVYPVSDVVGSLGLAILNQQLKDGHSIEIPSLGIIITPKQKSQAQ
jgi:hypothetical protein